MCFASIFEKYFFESFWHIGQECVTWKGVSFISYEIMIMIILMRVAINWIIFE